MLRILHVVTNMDRGGLETMIMNYYRKIDRDKIQFDFLTHRTGHFDYDDEIKSLGGIIYSLPRLNPFSLRYRNALSNFFSEHSEYKIIHVHQDCLSSIILKEAERHKVPVRIAHAHSSNQDKNIKLLIKLFYKRFIPKYATQLFACGKEAGDWMFGGAPYDIINNAIDSSKYVYNPDKRKSIRTDLSIQPYELIIGHVGRFAQVKNHTFLIDVFHEISKQYKAKLLLVGDGEFRDTIDCKVKAYNLEDKVIFTGVQSNVSDYLQAMDVFVFPSLYEGLPLTLVEAQASGLPCVISDAIPSECKKTDLVTQLSLDSGSEKWAEMVIALSQTKRKDTSAQIIASGFDIKNNANKLADFYIEEYANILKTQR